MLCTLEELKLYLNITTSDQDAWLTQQAKIISSVIENYCGRKFLKARYSQTYYHEDFADRGYLFVDKLETYHFPLVTLTSAEDNGIDISTGIRIQKPMGLLTKTDGFFSETGPIVLEYTAGYDVSEIPDAIKEVLFSLVQERYNKKQSNVALNFGSDVQRVSIPGTMSIDFDYSLQTNERSSAFGTILGNYVNSLDYFRSERALIGSGRVTYVENI